MGGVEIAAPSGTESGMIQRWQEASPWSAPPRHPSAAAAPGTPVVGALVGCGSARPGSPEGIAQLRGCRPPAAPSRRDQSADKAAHSKELKL